MATFNGHTVTIKGAKLLSRALIGEGKFIFTKGAFGAGKYEGDVTTLEELIDKRLDLPLSDVTYYEGAAVLNLQISNKTVEEEFLTNELGLYAKIEGDEEEVLFSYTTAIKADTIPDNSLSVTFEGEHEIYIKLTTGEKVGVQVNDDNVYITFRSGNREYVRTGCNIIGLLSLQTELIENGQYQAGDGKWYLNIGGKRSWNKSGTPDGQLKDITFLQHEKEIKELSNKIDTKISKIILGTITNEGQLNNAVETGMYKVDNYSINGLYGYGFLYVTKDGNQINQFYISHRGGTCYRQDWDGNIANGQWITQFNTNGGTIDGNVTVTGNSVTNGAVSCNSLILNGYTITIE